MNKVIFHIITTLTFSLYLSFAVAQKEGNVWYFGEYAGLDFNSGAPTPLSNGALNTKEGCASICDEEGNLLFYTDGMSVWNRDHQFMPNGRNLNGHPSSTQSGVIVPQPGNKSIYYLFTVDGWGEEQGLQYGIIDMSLGEGMGDMVVKNQMIYTPATEKITAVKHSNNMDIWVITHALNSNEFRTFLVSDRGFNPDSYVSSKVGMNHLKIQKMALGSMKVSPDGSKLALANFTQFFELFDFDNSTGKVSNPKLIQMPIDHGSYGVEFSPDQSKLYVTSERTNTIQQLDLTLDSPAKIAASSQVIGTTSSDFMGGLQVGPDGRIYVAKWNSKYLGVINNPNVSGASCDYDDEGVYLNGKVSKQGLPTFVQTYFEDPMAPGYAYPCGMKNCLFKVPHTFSPSGKSKHTRFQPIGCEPDGYTMYIYDKQDNIILKTTNFYLGWDGRIKLEDAEEGAYRYHILYKDEENRVNLMKGEVKLVF